MMDREELKRLAEELRGLKWIHTGNHYGDNGAVYREIVTSEGDKVIGDACGPNDDEAAHIAAANPAAILDLLAQLEAKEAEIARRKVSQEELASHLLAAAEEVNALRASRKADIERAVRLTCEISSTGIFHQSLVREILSQMEQPK